MSTNALRTVTTEGEKDKNVVVAFRDFLEKQKHQIALALPKHLTPDRMIRLATTEFAKNATLQKCTVMSVYSSIIQAAQLGLEIGVLGQAYLVPYRNNKNNTYEAQFIPGYKGLIALARRSGEVTSIETHIVYEQDHFKMQLGIDAKVEHEPYLDGDRGKPRLVYGVARFRDGGHHFEWMSIDSVNKIRARSKAKDNGPWVTDYDQMVRKTLIRRMANYLPMSIELAAAIQVDDAINDGKRATIDGDFIVTEHGEIEEPAADAKETGGATAPQESTQAAQPTFEQVRARLDAARDIDMLDADADLIRELVDDAEKKELTVFYKARRAELEQR